MRRRNPVAKASTSRLTVPDQFLKDWAALYQNAGHAKFFQSPAWMSAWLGGIPAETDLYRIDVIDDDGVKLLGVAGRPRRRAPRLIGFTEARLHEFGNPDYDAIYVEYNDFLTAQGADDLRVPALHALLDEFNKADSVVFRNITPAMKLAVEKVAASRSLNLRILSEQPVYVCDLERPRAEGSAFIDSLGAGLRADIRRSLRGYEERGAVRCRFAQSTAEKARAWERLVELHTARWRARGKPGAFANPQFLSFHERLCNAAPDHIQLLEIRVGDQTLGILYNFIDGDAVRQYQTGFFYEDDKRLKPGLVCHALACQYYMDNGFAYYDFMAGDAEYKRRFGDQQTVLTSVALDRRSWRRNAYRLFKGSARSPQKRVKHNHAP